MGDKPNLTIVEKIEALDSAGATTVPMADVRQLIQVVKELFEGSASATGLGLYGEVGDLARFINKVRKDLESFQPQDIAEKGIPDTSDQLDAIVKTTEQATVSIMDACERLEASHNKLKNNLNNINTAANADAEAEAVFADAQESITSIYESCNFQDLTGQKIHKIVDALREIERHVLRMVMVFGLQHKSVNQQKRQKLEEGAAELLHGPSLSGKSSLNQDDIDDILDALL